MAIVAHRVLQRLIRDNSSFMSREQRARHASAINRGGEESLSTEWEILVLNALAKRMTLRHEALIGARRPDIVAELTRADQKERFVADIATIYRLGYEERNPIDALREELHMRARRAGLTGRGFDIYVEGELEGVQGKQKMLLKLPARSVLSKFLDDRVEPFVKLCALKPTSPRQLQISEDRIDLRIVFAGSSTSMVSYPSFTTNYSKTNNPIFNVLKRKASQLSNTSFEGPRGVILCAADIDLRDHRSSGYGLRQIAAEVFRKHRGLSFILAISSLGEVAGRGRYQSERYLNADADFPLGPMSVEALERSIEELPEPRNSGLNALHELRSKRQNRGRQFFGRWKVTANSVQVSSRLLLEYLAGRMPQREFLDRLGGDSGFVPFFAQRLESGQMLVGAEVVYDPERDDDLIVFRFGNPDPAIAPLQTE